MPEYNFASEFMRMLSILGMMILVLLIVSWVLKRMMSTRMERLNTDSTIQILERRPLGPKAALYLLEVEGKKMVIAESPSGIHHLADLEAEKEESSSHELV